MHLIFLPREEKNSEGERIKQAGVDVFLHGERGKKELAVERERDKMKNIVKKA